MPRQYHRTITVVVVALMVASVMSVGGLALDAADEQADDAQAETIDSCTTITEPGKYVLSSDIENANGTCIRIETSDVVLDGNGHTIAGVTNESRRDEFREATMAPSVVFSDNETAQNETLVAEVVANYPLPTNPRWANIGVAANASAGLSNVTVRDVTVTEFTFGIYYEGVSNGNIENVTADSNGDGIDVFNSTDTGVADTRLVDNQFGLFALNVTDATVSGVTAEGNAVSTLAMFFAPEVRITETAISESPIGVVLLSSDGAMIDDSTVTDSAYTGIGVFASRDVRLTDVNVTNTTAEIPPYLAESPPPFEAPAGINLDNTSDSLLRNVTASDNADWAYYSTNGSVANVGEQVVLNGTALSFTATDVALSIEEGSVNASEERLVGDNLVATNTTADAALTLRVTWGTGSTSPTATANETVTPSPASTPTPNVTDGNGTS